MAQSQASVHQGTGPVPPPTGSWHMARLHRVGSVCCERPPGVPRGSSSDHGRRRARLPAWLWSGNWTIDVAPSGPGAGQLDPALLKGGKQREFKAEGTPKTTVSFSPGPLPKTRDTEGGAAGKWAVPPAAHAQAPPACHCWAALQAFLGHWALLGPRQFGLWKPPGQTASLESPVDMCFGIAPLSSHSCPHFSGSGEHRVELGAHRGKHHLPPGQRYREAVKQEFPKLVSSDSPEKLAKPAEPAGPPLLQILTLDLGGPQIHIFNPLHQAVGYRWPQAHT